jgi:hypothetical protein
MKHIVIISDTHEATFNLFKDSFNWLKEMGLAPFVSRFKTKAYIIPAYDIHLKFYPRDIYDACHIDSHLEAEINDMDQFEEWLRSGRWYIKPEPETMPVVDETGKDEEINQELIDTVHAAIDAHNESKKGDN